MEVRLPLLIRPAKIKSLRNRTLSVVKRFLLLSGDCSEGRRWIDARLRAVQVDDAPVGHQEHCRDHRGLEQVAAPDILADEGAGLHDGAVHDDLNVSGHFRPLNVFRCVDDV